MEFNFYQYSGLGNDFILIETLSSLFLKRQKWQKIAKSFCLDFKSDGLIVFKPSKDSFEMIVINPDGSFATMCGNATRCAMLHFYNMAKKKKCSFNYIQIYQKKKNYLICDGEINNSKISITYRMPLDHRGPYNLFKRYWHYVNSGTDHAVTFLENNEILSNLNVNLFGKKIRWHETFQPFGVNVNFVSRKKDTFYLRTFERGVERETLSCGTGSIAAVIADMIINKKNKSEKIIIQKSGKPLIIKCLIKSKSILIEQSGGAMLLRKNNYEK